MTKEKDMAEKVKKYFEISKKRIVLTNGYK